MGNFQVTLLPSNQTFSVDSKELILDAAIRQGIDVSYTCRNGTCRTCIFQVLQGNTIQEDADSCMITPQELEMNRRLICLCTLQSDAVLEKVSPKRRKQLELIEQM